MVTGENNKEIKYRFYHQMRIIDPEYEEEWLSYENNGHTRQREYDEYENYVQGIINTPFLLEFVQYRG